MYSMEDIYICFRKSQANANNRGYRLPKNFEKHYSNKMSKTNRDALKLITDYFNTKWSNINPETYFDCGFEILKGFSYRQFFDERVLNLYKTRDKNNKREMELNKRDLKKSFTFVKEYMRAYDIPTMKEYCRLRDGYMSMPIKHHLHNYIDKYFIVLMIMKGYIILNDDDRAKIPYVLDQYRECVYNLNTLKEEYDNGKI